AVIDLQQDQLAQQCRLLRLRHGDEVVLNAGPLPGSPGGLVAVALPVRVGREGCGRACTRAAFRLTHGDTSPSQGWWIIRATQTLSKFSQRTSPTSGEGSKTPLAGAAAAA